MVSILLFFLKNTCVQSNNYSSVVLNSSALTSTRKSNTYNVFSLVNLSYGAKSNISIWQSDFNKSSSPISSFITVNISLLVSELSTSDMFLLNDHENNIILQDVTKLHVLTDQLTMNWQSPFRYNHKFFKIIYFDKENSL